MCIRDRCYYAYIKACRISSTQLRKCSDNARNSVVCACVHQLALYVDVHYILVHIQHKANLAMNGTLRTFHILIIDKVCKLPYPCSIVLTTAETLAIDMLLRAVLRNH